MPGRFARKIIGADAELANFVLGADLAPGTSTAPLAALLLAREVDGIPAEKDPCTTPYPMSSEAQVAEWGRKFLPSNGSSVYIDAHHLEINTPETFGPADFVAAWRAMLRIAEQARCAAQRRLKPGFTLQVIANTSDRRSNSFGSHLSVATTRTAWTRLSEHGVLRWLASFHVSSILITGAGKAGFENGARPADFQLSERADFFGRLTTLDTTGPNRGIVNKRDEALSGKHKDRARYHCICYDSNLQDIAAYLKAGMLAIVMLMLEAGAVDLTCAFWDPVTAFGVVSRDLTFESALRTVDGNYATALDLQTRFVDDAARFVESVDWEEWLPGAPQVIKVWVETLDMLRRHDLPSLARRLDWALKLSLCTRLMDQNPELDWNSPEVRYADLQYANLDPARGLFWACETAGLVERIVSPGQIAHFVSNPPENTRAFARAMLLRHAGADRISEMDWDSITFRRLNGTSQTFRLRMDDASALKPRSDRTWEEVVNLVERDREVADTKPAERTSL